MECLLRRCSSIEKGNKWKGHNRVSLLTIDFLMIFLDSCVIMDACQFEAMDEKCKAFFNLGQKRDSMCNYAQEFEKVGHKRHYYCFFAPNSNLLMERQFTMSRKGTQR